MEKGWQKKLEKAMKEDLADPNGYWNTLKKQKEFEQKRFDKFEEWLKTNEFEPLLKKLINFIIKLYGGAGNYNLLLSAAHDNVVLRLSSFNEIYEKLLEDKLEIILPFKRRTKRYLLVDNNEKAEK